jgi:hypothetical protein
MRGLCAFSASAEKPLWTSAKKLSTPNHRTRQNQLVRINHSHRACLVSTLVGNSSPTLCPPCLCALRAKFPFPASLCIATLAPGRRLVAQVAAPFAGPEAFSCRIFPPRPPALCSSGAGADAFLGARPEAFVRESAYVAAFATPVECALTQKHRGGGCASRTLLMLSSRAPSRGPQRARMLRVVGWGARGICF